MFSFPVYDLKERCLQVVRRLVKKEDVAALRTEIPKSLQDDLLHPKPSKIIWEAPPGMEDEEEEWRFMMLYILYK